MQQKLAHKPLRFLFFSYVFVYLKQNYTLLAKTPEDIYRWGKIEEIQIDSIPVLKIKKQNISIKAGIKVSFKPKNNQVFSLMPIDLSTVF